MRASVLWLVAVATSACNLETVSPLGIAPRAHKGAASDAGEEASDVGGDTVLASVAGGAYQSSPAFARITNAPYASAAAQGSWISEWVTADAWTAYAAITPDATGSGVKVPPGTTIVRAVLDAKGVTKKLTLMAKGPPGFNPDLGDWWFGETDPNGAPLSEDGGVLTGRLKQCYSCHLARATDDFLFGVPTNDQAPPK